MKKTVIIAALGVAGMVVSSYGQGSIAFDTYNAQNFAGILTTYGNGPLAGQGLDSTFTGELLWSATPINDAATTAGTAGSPLTDGWTVGSTALFDTGNAAGPGGIGYVSGPNLNISQAVGQVLYFEIVAFNGADYASSTYSGHSAAFTATLATGTTLPNANQLNNLVPFSVFQVVPEPTTLALAGLGGLAALVAYRRKQA
ncbi:MAG TPA: PEP-CTERM sorting domain-containing protein [Verrucomicrobiae bacterium]|nr:PEP-CTERM sorting domain-containing protein [Verrucomicrobiae bacterium]